MQEVRRLEAVAHFIEHSPRVDRDALQSILNAIVYLRTGSISGPRGIASMWGSKPDCALCGKPIAGKVWYHPGSNVLDIPEMRLCSTCDARITSQINRALAVQS